MSASSEVRVVFLGNSASAVRSVNTLSGSLGGLGRTVGFVSKALTVGLIGGMLGAAKAAVTYDRSLRNLNSISKLSETQLKALSKQILALAKVSGKGPTELADAMYEVASSGFQAGDALKILRVTSKAATAGMTDTTTATKAVVSVLNSYGLGADKAGKVADTLFSVVERGVLSFSDLATQLGDVLPVAAQLGVPLEELGGAIATVTLGGVSAAETMTQLKQVMVSFIKPSDELSATIKRLGFESGEAMIRQVGLEGAVTKLSTAAKGNASTIADWFPNIRALSGFLAVSGKNVERLTANIDAMSKRGAFAAAFAEQSKSISVQWDKAKVSLIAAAIPLGQLLFPLLRRGAEAVADFAMSIEARMPMLRAQFADLAGAVQQVGGALVAIGRSHEGQTALAGLLSGFAGAKAASGVQNFVAQLKGVNPAVALISGAFALLGAVIFHSLTATTALERRLASMVGTAIALRGALDSQAQAHLLARQAATQLEVSTFNLEVAQKAAAKAARDYGAGSVQHKQALLAVRMLVDQLAQSKLNLTRANEAAATSDEQASARTKEHKAQLASANKEAGNAAAQYARVSKEIVGVGLGAMETNPHLKEMLHGMRDDAVKAYADAHADATRAMGGTKREADLARAAVYALHAQLGRLPESKEIEIFIRTFRTQSKLEEQRGRLPGRSRAVGGFVPGSRGMAVPILAHAGEVVLNQAQQTALGGSRMIADFFGFHGERGPSFAAGGIVGRRGLRKAKPSPWRPLRRRAKAASGAAREALTAVEAVNQSQSNLDRMYGQLAREFDISQEEFVVEGPDGSEVLNPAGIAQRVSEIDRLVEHRNQMLALIDQEKAELQKAIERLREAIKRLQAAIRAEIRAANADARAIRRLEAKKNRSKADERQLESLRASEQGHRSTATTYDSRVQEFSQAWRGASGDLANVIPFDRRDVELDIMELAAERRLVTGTRARPGVGGGGATSFIADAVQTIIGGGVDLSGALEEAQRTIGQLRLALGLEAVQIPILGGFEKGTLHVPQRGLYELHAGERVTPAGVAAVGSRSGDERPVVEVVLSGGLSEQDIDVKIHGAYDGYVTRQGREADRRRRGGNL